MTLQNLYLRQIGMKEVSSRDASRESRDTVPYCCLLSSRIFGPRSRGKRMRDFANKVAKQSKKTQMKFPNCTATMQRRIFTPGSYSVRTSFCQL